MKPKTFWRAFLSGLASLGKGMASLSLFLTKSSPSYKEQFGTDKERLAFDLQKVGDDFRKSIKHFENKLDELTRCECSEPATWIRRTQFAGNHFFCTAHAEQEKDFGESDLSYFFWEEIPAS